MYNTENHDTKMGVRYERATAPDRLRMRIGQVVRSARKARGLTQNEVALMSGLAQPCIAAVEGGYRRIGTKNLVRLLSALGVEHPEDVAASFKHDEAASNPVTPEIAEMVSGAVSRIGSHVVSRCGYASDDTTRQCGSDLRVLRSMIGWTARDLADAVGASAQAIANIEQGRVQYKSSDVWDRAIGVLLREAAVAYPECFDNAQVRVR